METNAFHAKVEDERRIFDSGAGGHFTGQRDALIDFVLKNKEVEVADNRVIISPGYGAATLKNDQGDFANLPGAVNRLLSVDWLASKGANVELVSTT